MRPVIARRITTCYYCKDPIVKGSERLSDTIRVRNPQRDDGNYLSIKRHFHFRKEDEATDIVDTQSCHDKWVVEIFAKMPPPIIESNNPKGRPVLDLTKTQRDQRRELLKRLNSQVRYYITEGHLDLSRPQYLTEVTLRDVRKATRFRDNMICILKDLEKVGGIPKKYEGYLVEEETEEKVA